MVSRWHPDDAYSRFLLPKARLGPKQVSKKIMHPETHVLYYKCHLRYIFNYTL